MSVNLDLIKKLQKKLIPKNTRSFRVGKQTTGTTGTTKNKKRKKVKIRRSVARAQRDGPEITENNRLLQKVKTIRNNQTKNRKRKAETKQREPAAPAAPTAPKSKPQIIQENIVTNNTEPVGEKKIPKQKTKRKPRLITNVREEDFQELDIQNFMFDDQVELKRKLPPKRKKGLRYNRYILNNNKDFLSFVKKKFNLKKYERQPETKSEYITLFPHQKLVRDYLDFLSPYRGLFLYFGLGTGKTCSSIAIAEGLKDYNKIVVMTPASLAQNYKSQLMFCGDLLFKKNQYWEKVSIKNNPERIYVLQKVLGLPQKYIRKHNGAWLVNYEKFKKHGPNYNELAANDPSIKIAIDKQIEIMIDNKYHFISYNGLNEKKMKLYEGNFETDDTDTPAGETKQVNKDIYGVKQNGGNFFNNKVIIIDEVHNLISRIVNKLNANDSKSIAVRLYKLLMDAENCRIVFLSGTPIINYPNEIAIFYNILRGTIRSFSFKLNIKKSISKDNFVKLIRKKLNNTDYIEYKPSTETLIITINPFNFIDRYDTSTKEYRGVGRKKLRVRENPLYTTSYNIKEAVKKAIIGIADVVSVTDFERKCFEDNFEKFTNYFINEKDGTLKKKAHFQRRIIGLTSYYKNKNTDLLPRFNPETDIITERVVMSQHQLSKYEKVRLQEHKSATDAIRLRKMNDLYKKATNSYRTFSRLYCNFTFPDGIERPMPPKKEKKNLADATIQTTGSKTQETKKTATSSETNKQGEISNQNQETTIEIPENVNLEENAKNDTELSNDGEKKESRNDIYNRLIKEAITKLKARQDTVLVGDGLAQHSPKYFRMYNNIINPPIFSENQEVDTRALHLIYSSFYSLEGLGIFKLVLEANGFVEFTIEKNIEKNNQYDIMMDEAVLNDINIPKFVIFSGTTTTEVKEMYRLIYNGEWDERLPPLVKSRLEAIPNHENNLNANVIKCFMITSSGAEGINLKNTRYVHIMEPYWHPVREEQVIGRAVRLNSHINLPEEKRFVKVFKYLTVFSYEQINGKNEAGEVTTGTIKMISPQIKKKDVSKLDKNKIITTDEALEEISSIKKNINTNILNAIKQSAIDCKIHNEPGSEEYKQCFEINPRDYSDRYVYTPFFEKDDTSIDSNLNKVVRKKKKSFIINFNHNNLIKKCVFVINHKKTTKTEFVGTVYLYEDIINATVNGKTNLSIVTPLEKNHTITKTIQPETETEKETET